MLLEVVRRDDGTFDLFLNHALDRSRIPGEWLSREVCSRWGFCGAEYESIVREIEKHGRATREFSVSSASLR
jgi:hypothetical protein